MVSFDRQRARCEAYKRKKDAELVSENAGNVSETPCNTLEIKDTFDTINNKQPQPLKQPQPTTTSSSKEDVADDDVIKQPWESHIDSLRHEGQWKEIMAMRTGLKMEFFSLYPRIVECFKNHVRALGKERSILSSSDAKQYFCFFLAPGSNTFQRLMAQLKQPSDKDSPYRFEERDPTTGQRSYCGVPIPPDAPPRPNAQAVWNSETKQWNF